MQEVVIEGEVVRVTFSSERTAFRVVKVRITGEKEPVAVVGKFPEVREGARVRVSGVREKSDKHGDQIRAETVTELGPATLRGLERYLSSGGIRGIGPKTAERIVAHFGMDALAVLDESPERLTEVPGLGSAKASQVAVAWREQRGVREIMVFLQAHGASLALGQRIHKRFGADAMHIVSREPYRLAIEVAGVGFVTADRIARSLGIAPNAPERLQAGVLHALGELVDEGHCHVSREMLFSEASKLLGEPSEAQLDDALRSLVLGGWVAAESQGELPVYSAMNVHRAECRVAARLGAIANAKLASPTGADGAVQAFEASRGVTLADEQRQAALAAASSPLLVVTGGPGVGKTTVLRAILEVFDSAGIVVRLAAPTGRAAKRMTEATGRPAQTLHRLLEVDPKSGGFKRGAHNPLEAGAIVVDEASMIDIFLADALTQAIADGTRLLLVGDVDQLPSVGPGAVLRDVIDSGVVPCVRLVHIYRQARQSRIVVSAHRVNAGLAPEGAAAGEEQGDFFIVHRKDAASARSTVLELVTSRIPKRFGLDALRDVQVLVPMNRGEAGSVALNAALQAALNPEGPSLDRAGRVLRSGDKVMQQRNDYDKDVYNGDLGVIDSVDVAARTLRVRFDDRVIVYDESQTDDLSLAYACTVHKAQGSEYPAVVVVMLGAHFVMLAKSLLYTAITRGKQLVVLVTDAQALRVCLARDRRGDRRTLLSERLRRECRAAG